MYSGTVSAWNILLRSAFTLVIAEMLSGSTVGEYLFHSRTAPTGTPGNVCVLMNDLNVVVCMFAAVGARICFFVTRCGLAG
jgi:hypothetical protein